MSDILFSDLTNATVYGNGTGVFDKLMQTVTLHVTNEYDEGRISGSDYAEVYLGSLQAVLSQATQFLLSEQKAGKDADLVDAQINESEEKLDLIRAQTAKEYEVIQSSQDNTSRENLINNKELTKLDEEVYNIQADTIDKNYVTQVTRPGEVASVNSDIAVKAQQEYMLKDKNGGVLAVYSYYLNGVSGAIGTTTDLSTVVGSVISTEMTDGDAGDGVSVTALDKVILNDKSDLISAQTLGFKTDTKQKVLKQMHDGYAVNLSIANVGNQAAADNGPAIDDLTNEILADVGTSIIPW